MGSIGKIFALILILILTISSLSLFAALPFGSAQSGTNVGGIITSDTTWTQANSPYNFVDNVTVAFGSTLTIMAGTVIDLRLCSFIISGTLCAKGDASNRIIFKGQQRLSYS
jgi:hypothetical protein